MTSPPAALRLADTGTRRADLRGGGPAPRQTLMGFISLLVTGLGVRSHSRRIFGTVPEVGEGDTGGGAHLSPWELRVGLMSAVGAAIL